MRLAVIVNRFPVISETFVLNQITGLMDRGHEVDIFSWNPGKGERVHPDVEAYGLMRRTRYWPGRHRGGLRTLPALFRLMGNSAALRPALRTLRVSRFGGRSAATRVLAQAVTVAGLPPYDALLCHFGRVGRLALMLRDIGAIEGRLVTVFHGSDMSQLLVEQGERFYDDLLARGELSLPISHHWRDRLIELGGDPERIVVHRMGIDCENFEFTPRRPSPDGVVRVLSVARLVEKKGIEFGIRAIRRLVDRGRRVHYTIVGEGPRRSQVEALIQSQALEPHVELVGWRTQDELVSLMRHQHILLSPSVTATNGDQEGIPVALMEAMAMGFPVVTTHHSGIPELVRDRESGYLVPERDVDALADRLDHLLLHPQEWEPMGRAGRAAVGAEFNVDTLNDRLVELLAAGKG